MKIKLLILVSFFFLSVAKLHAQADVSAQVGKGIQLKTEDDIFYLKFRTRIQARWDFENTLSNSYYDKEGNLIENPAAIYENKAWIKRSRLKFDGYFLNKNLVYKIEYDVVGGYVRDAMIKYRMDNVQIWFGQGKLPGNRERVVSSANLQMVDRSVFNKYYNIDRDIGFQLHHHFNIGQVLIRDRWAVTSGNGILDNKFSGGVSLTSKIEVLPFGAFTSKGDYKSADLVREPSPKLALTAYVNYNKSSYKDRGQVGTVMDGKADLLNYGFDALYKHKGYSLMIEGGSRMVTDNGEIIYDDAGLATASFYTGYGANVQTGYIFKNNWEMSGRYSFTKPNDNDFNKDITDYTLGVSKYIIGHSFKLQADVTYRDRLYSQDMVIGRFQLEFQF